MLSTVDRRDYIVQLIRDRGKVHVKSLSTKFKA
jgi:DeoR/GlpR family transcriptional regulator of sugar metabolism